MFRELLDQVRREASGARALETVRELARFHRVQSSPGYDRAARWMAERLRSFGLEPVIETVPGDGRTRFLGELMPEGWECAHAHAFLHDGASRERICDDAESPLSLVLRSAPARGRYRVVAVDGGSRPEDYSGVDLKGAIALVRSPGARRPYELAVLERGAAGLLCDGRRLVPPVRDAFDDPDALAYTSFWWNGDEPRGFGFVVSPRQGQRLRAMLAAGKRLELEVEIESRRFPTEIPLLTATVGDASGPPADGDEILVVAHLCHPLPSANDNASGAAAALETARVLAALRERDAFCPARTVRFLWVPELTGTFAWLGREPARARRIAAAINLDMVGENQELCGSTFLIEHPPSFTASFAEELLSRIRDESVDWVTSYSGPGHYSMTRMAEVPFGGGSDHAVFVDPGIGVPCPMLIQWPDRFYHSSHDTPDKTDPNSLALAVRCAATYAAFLAAAGDPERDWLSGEVARGARVRLLRAVSSTDAFAVERERQRGRRAIESLARLGIEPRTIDLERREFEEFAAREAFVPHAARAPAVTLPAGAHQRVFRRRFDAPLDFQAHMIEGFEKLTAAEREEWRKLEAAAPESALLFELAWMACDGRRSLEEIARLVELEAGHYEPASLARFFGFAARLGAARPVSSTEEAWSTSAPATDTP